MLESVCVPRLANTVTEFTGLDSPDRCLDRAHWHSWPDHIDYRYNSRGFRDQEWPNDLTTAVWCVGDSFTSGLGSAWLNTWPQVLQRQLGRRTVTVSQDGASNNWIADQCCEIAQAVRPCAMVVMWSYLHRRPGVDQQPLLYSGTTMQQDYENLLQCQQQVRDCCVDTQLVEFVIPNWQPVLSQTAWQQIRDPSWFHSVNNLGLGMHTILAELHQTHGYDPVKLRRQIQLLAQYPILNSVLEVPQLDRARDGHHFDCVTAQWVADRVCDSLRQRPSPSGADIQSELDLAADLGPQGQ